MKKEINQNNGDIINNPEEADVIIVKSDSFYIDEEIEKLKKYHHKTVTEKWYIDCISKNEYQSIDEKKDLLSPQEDKDKCHYRSNCWCSYHGSHQLPIKPLYRISGILQLHAKGSYRRGLSGCSTICKG